MKKQLIAIFAMVMSIASYHTQAQSSVATGPNKVYIEQIGSSNTLTIEQVGGTNMVGGVTETSKTISNTNVTTLVPADPSATNYGTITGSTNTLAITQTGNNNSAQYNIKGNNNIYNSTVTGNNNQTQLNIGDVNNANNLRNSVNEVITGNDNLAYTNLVGSDITSALSVTGSSNQVVQDLKSTNGTSTIDITGSNNILYAQQVDSAGANGHSLVQNILGDYNSITTQQQGSNDTTVNISTNGSHNTITVRSSSSSVASPLTAIAR
jgi:hypothetical protein